MSSPALLQTSGGQPWPSHLPRPKRQARPPRRREHRPPSASSPRAGTGSTRAGCAPLLIGAISLLAFLLVWHLLTKYRVVFFVRFTNVPSPLAVYDSFTKAIHDPKFLLHIALSCRRILIGFSLAAIVAVPLGLDHGPLQAGP